MCCLDNLLKMVQDDPVWQCSEGANIHSHVVDVCVDRAALTLVRCVQGILCATAASSGSVGPWPSARRAAGRSGASATGRWKNCAQVTTREPCPAKHTQSIPRPPPSRLARHCRARAPPGQNFFGPVMLRVHEASPVQLRTQLLQPLHRLRSLSQPLPLPRVPRQQLHFQQLQPRIPPSREATGSPSTPQHLPPKHLRLHLSPKHLRRRHSAPQRRGQRARRA